MKRIIYLISATCLLLFSCSKSEILTLSKHNVEFTSVGGEQEIVVVNASTKWEAKSDANWLSTETRGGMKNGTIVVNVQPNSSPDERSAKILVMTLDGSNIEEITISQQGGNLFQIYNENGTPFTGDIELVGVPSCTHGSFDRPGAFPSSTTSSDEHPWEISGVVKEGIMTIDFPNRVFNLTSEYKNATEGLTVGQVFIEQKDNIWIKIGLHKKSGDYDNQVYILYVADDFSNELVTFKSGWNFVEIVHNPNWEYGNGEPSRIIGIISQTVDIFMEKDYRWKIEHWIGPR